MKPAERAIALLDERLGLLPELLNEQLVKRALDSIFGKREQSVGTLDADSAEWQRLVDEVTVQETWFFRDVEPFRLLAAHVTGKWLPANPAGPFRVLSVACATGEEPFSVAITLLEAALPADRIRIDALDVSGAALEQARQGLYRKTSFRNRLDETASLRYFEPCKDGLRIRPEVSGLVRFEQANLLDLSAYRSRGPYDAVFCRNALIYLTTVARRHAIAELRDLVSDDGLLFVGHSELMLFLEAGWFRVEHERGFACMKGAASSEAVHPEVHGHAQRKVRRAHLHAHATVQRMEPTEELVRAKELADRGDLAAAA
ncbi:MAG: protein-glutamate O-methyltransferase CheR, partial [Bryobacteraceae bacterium]